MRAHIWNLGALCRLGRNVSRLTRESQVTLYAAQAAFFILLAIIPLLSLLLSVCSFFVPLSEEDLLSFLAAFVPSHLHEAVRALAGELGKSGGVRAISLSALTALYGASRGVASLERGLAGVYGVSCRRGFLRDALRSVAYTLVLILAVFGSLFTLVFGGRIARWAEAHFPALSEAIGGLLSARAPTVFFILALFFYIAHRTVLRRAYKGETRHTVLPGALLSALGWMLFSLLYSLYVDYFPSASYLYGSLALLMFLLLWLYFCMVIFLSGALLNRVLERASADSTYLASFLR